MTGASLIAWVPFVEPMRALQPIWFLLLIPLAFGISVIYKALRMDDLTRFWRSTLITTVAIIGGVVGLGVLFAVLIEWIVPAVPVTMLF